MASAGLQQLFDELKAVVLDAEAAAHDGAATGAADAAPGSPGEELAGAPAPAGVDRLVARTTDYVRTHPWQALGIAAATGLLVGFALRRK